VLIVAEQWGPDIKPWDLDDWRFRDVVQAKWYWRQVAFNLARGQRAKNQARMAGAFNG
jgi:hypothetical protein